jgi:PAS domain S-box-containing protein
MPGPSTELEIGRVVRVLGVAASYFGLSYVGTVLSLPPSGFAIVWPSTAFLIGVLLMTPRTLWPLYLAGVIPVHLVLLGAFHQADLPIVVVLLQLAGNLSMAVATAVALPMILKQPVHYRDFRAISIYLFAGGILLIGAESVVVLSIYMLIGWVDDFWLSLRQWMLATVFPTMTIPPLMMMARDRNLTGRGTSESHVELAVLSLLLFTLTYVPFGWDGDRAWSPTLLLMPFPLMLWAAVRLGLGGTCISLWIFASAIILRALEGNGPFAAGAAEVSVMSLQVFLTALCVPLLLLAALIEEGRRTHELLRQSEARMEVVAASTETGLWQWDEIKQQVWATEHCRTMLGLTPTEPFTPQVVLEFVHPHDRPRLRGALRWMLVSPDVAALKEFRIVRRDGQTRWFIAHTHTDFDRNGKPARISGVFRDVTVRAEAQQQARKLSQQLLTLQEEERQLIAQDLHDSTAQHLVAISLNLGLLAKRLKTGAALSVMDEMRASLKQATDELRTFTYLLRPAGLDSEGVCAVIGRYLEGFARRTGLKVSFRATAVADQLPLAQQRALLRIVQECLMNVHRHAGARSASVSMRCAGANLHLIIKDDGRGMQDGHPAGEGEPERTGVGIPGIKTRVGQMSGTASIRSSKRGTIVHIAIPIIYQERAQLAAIEHIA